MNTPSITPAAEPPLGSIYYLPHIRALDRRCNDTVAARVELERQLEEAKRLLRDTDHRLAEAREAEHLANRAYCDATQAARVAYHADRAGRIAPAGQDPAPPSA